MEHFIYGSLLYIAFLKKLVIQFKGNYTIIILIDMETLSLLKQSYLACDGIIIYILKVIRVLRGLIRARGDIWGHFYLLEVMRGLVFQEFLTDHLKCFALVSLSSHIINCVYPLVRSHN